MAKPGQYTFSKDEKLCSVKIIDSLFESGKSIRIFPIQIVWNYYQPDHSVPVQVVFIVSKRNFKHAVDRNRIRRQLREIYRQHKQQLVQTCRVRNKQIAIMLVFRDKKLNTFNEIERKIILILHRLKETLQADDQ